MYLTPTAARRSTLSLAETSRTGCHGRLLLFPDCALLKRKSVEFERDTLLLLTDRKTLTNKNNIFFKKSNKTLWTSVFQELSGIFF